MKKNKITYEATFKGHPIMADKAKMQGCHAEGLDRALTVLTDATDDHNKILFFRADVHYPKTHDAPADNRDITRFHDNYKKGLKLEGLDPRILWAREQAKSANQHFHLAVMLDGSKTQSPHNHLDRAERCWNHVLGLPEDAKGYVHRCETDRDGSPQENGVLLRRGDADFNERFDGCLRRTSYMFKVNGRGGVPKGVRQFGGTETTNRDDNGDGHGRG